MKIMSQILSNEVIISVIDKGLSSLGESSKKAVWYCLENDFKIKRDELPGDIEKFEDVLNKFFGLGYGFLDSLFRLYLCEAIGEDLECYKTFSECIRGLRIKSEIVGSHKVCKPHLMKRF